MPPTAHALRPPWGAVTASRRWASGSPLALCWHGWGAGVRGSKRCPARCPFLVLVWREQLLWALLVSAHWCFWVADNLALSLGKPKAASSSLPLQAEAPAPLPSSPFQSPLFALRVTSMVFVVLSKRKQEKHVYSLLRTQHNLQITPNGKLGDLIKSSS